MAKISEYMNDGANRQARAVLAFLDDTIESSWDDNSKDYDCFPEVGRWENCREQGYVVRLRSKNARRQLNIAFFGHRNSDLIHTIRWEQASISSLTIDSANFGAVYATKWDTSASFGYGEITAAAKWINDEMQEWYDETAKEFSIPGEIAQL